MNLGYLAIIIAVLSLDTTIAFQTLISSPLFACPILGWILGDIHLGFELGFLLQLIWLSRIPAGAVIFPEGNLASMIVTSLILLNKSNGFPNTNLAIIFMEGILISFIGAKITQYYRNLNGKILDFVNKQVERAHFRIILLLEIFSILLYFLIMFFLTYIILFLSQLFLPIILIPIGSMFENQLLIVKPAILGLGLALTFPLFKETFKKGARK
jgi:PTS system mannose-specific IIC component